jgi:hypothetical protein
MELEAWDSNPNILAKKMYELMQVTPVPGFLASVFIK